MAHNIADIAPGRVYGAWTIARLDPRGRRALCVCRCGGTQQIAVSALEDGSDSVAGRREAAAAKPAPIHRPASKFASDLANIETHAALHRYKGETANHAMNAHSSAPRLTAMQARVSARVARGAARKSRSRWPVALPVARADRDGLLHVLTAIVCAGIDRSAR